ncbi:Mediator of RNA polymerase II transcription subunit 6 [Serendipita sp. 398]|nr:Mediator of RNA polymerase II transcription subunit 6 [Serendipita sp. 398]
MEYFEESFLFDRSSNNNVLRMQTQHADPNLRMGRLETENELKRFTGMEYALVHSQAPLFVIQQRDRLSPTEVRPTAVYFILNNVLYSAPDLYTLLSTKLTNALNMIQTSLDDLRSARPDYTPRIGHVWPIVDVPSTKLPGKSQQQQSNTRQGSLAPDPSSFDSAAKQADPATRQEEDRSKLNDDEDENRLIWEPFAYALHSTRVEMERKANAAMMARMQAGSSNLGVGGGFGPSSGVGNGDSGGLGGGASGGYGYSRGPGMNASAADNSFGLASTSGTGPNSAITGGVGGAFGGSGTGAGSKLLVPTANEPAAGKQKGVPGPPGKPGHGKKKQRRKLHVLFIALPLRNYSFPIFIIHILAYSGLLNLSIRC